MLILEDAGMPYTCSSDIDEPKAADPACFAPPFCKDSSGYTSQSTAICQHLGVKLGLTGGVNLAARGWAKDVAKDPAHLTIVPFKGGVPDPCTPSGCP